jgi:hypothetical protein
LLRKQGEKGGRTLKIVSLSIGDSDRRFFLEAGEANALRLPEKIVVSLSEEVFVELDDPSSGYPAEEHLKWVLGRHLEESFHPLWWEYIALRRRRLKRFALLLAHGGIGPKGEWCFWDGERPRRVQEWIDEQDGKFACLIVFSCNPGHFDAHSRKSLLVLADRDVTLREGPGGYVLSLLDPQFGEVDDYTIESRLAELRQAVSSGGA